MAQLKPMEEELSASTVQGRIELDAEQRGKERESNCRWRVRARRAAEPPSTARAREDGARGDGACHYRCQSQRGETRGGTARANGGERVRGGTGSQTGERRRSRRLGRGRFLLMRSRRGTGTSPAGGPARQQRLVVLPARYRGQLGLFWSLGASDRGGRIARSAVGAISRHHHATARPCPALGWPSMIAAR